jgi:acyl-CoA synthetase (AMP-forming)/AMP-acid ligase II
MSSLNLHVSSAEKICWAALDERANALAGVVRVRLKLLRHRFREKR